MAEEPTSANKNNPGIEPTSEQVSQAASNAMIANMTKASAQLQVLNSTPCPFQSWNRKKTMPWDEYVARFVVVAKKQEPPISPVAVQDVLAYLQSNQEKLKNLIKNKRTITINDFTQKSGEKRMYVLDLYTGEVHRVRVAHGIGSGKRDMVEKCSNKANSNATPPGFQIIGEQKSYSKFGSALEIHGLEKRNDNDLDRDIIFHPNKTEAQRQKLEADRGYIDHSEGCPQLTQEDYLQLRPLVEGGSLMYNFCPQ